MPPKAKPTRATGSVNDQDADTKKVKTAARPANGPEVSPPADDANKPILRLKDMKTDDNERIDRCDAVKIVQGSASIRRCFRKGIKTDAKITREERVKGLKEFLAIYATQSEEYRPTVTQTKLTLCGSHSTRTFSYADLIANSQPINGDTESYNRTMERSMETAAAKMRLKLAASPDDYTAIIDDVMDKVEAHDTALGEQLAQQQLQVREFIASLDEFDRFSSSMTTQLEALKTRVNLIAEPAPEEKRQDQAVSGS